MGFDEVIPRLGGFGRYQRRIYFLLCLPGICCAFHLLSNVFLQAKPNFRCRLPHEPANASYGIQNVSDSNITEADGICTILDDYKPVPCKTYIFDHSVYTTTTVTEWNLVCDRAYFKTIADSLLMFGVMVGAITLGDLSDRYGRKRIFFISLIAQVLFSTLAAFSYNFWIFVICRTMVGVGVSGYLVSYVIAMEMVKPKSRVFTGAICQLFFSLGYILMAGIAYFITEWRHLQIALALPGLLFLSYWWLIPESIRWLISKHRLSEAIQLIQVAARQNNIEISNYQIETLLVGNSKDFDDKKATVLDIFKYPTLRKRFMLLSLNWFVISCTYYGLSWNTSNLGGSDYINALISGVVELPGYSILLFTLNKWGRKIVLCGSMVTAGISLLLTSLAPKDSLWILITLTMIGKFAITSCYGTIYIFTTEQFPTVIRNAALGTCSMSARIGSMVAPVINMMNEIWKPFPMVIFGAMVLIGGGLSLQLPETLNRDLPETIEDCEIVEGIPKTQVLLEYKQMNPKSSVGNGISDEDKLC